MSSAARPKSNQCSNASDDDADGLANDGCPATGQQEASNYQCFTANTTDDDTDGRINDGCTAIGGPEAEDDCLGLGATIDNDGDGPINDGCAVVLGSAPAETVCAGAVDNDGDGYVNDGCPFVTAAPAAARRWRSATTPSTTTATASSTTAARRTAGETGFAGGCTNISDDDGDGVVNDGCTQKGGAESDAPCQNAIDDAPADGASTTAARPRRPRRKWALPAPTPSTMMATAT